MDHFYVCIMAGGSGERFWPLSRQTTPKHLLRLFSEATLLEETVNRVQLVVPSENIFVLTNAAQLEMTRQVLSDLPSGNIVAEPAKRDTAPATALGTALAHRRDPNAVVGFLPADALIQPGELFAHQLADAAEMARLHCAIVTFSIKPTRPATGFGYLNLGEPLGTTGGTAFRQVLRFVEKPDEPTAQEYVDSGNYGWNAGMFLWQCGTYLEEARRLQPELAEFVEKFPAGDFSTYLLGHFPELTKISVDYAIMEKANNVIAAEARFDWNDVGTWTALPEHLGRDPEGNCVKGDAITHEATGNIVFSQKRIVALQGVHDLVVVETEDAILICHKEQAQHIKQLQQWLPEEVK
ncbi:MAG: mannose-1-phosphate guanylyltransferase [Verrucomicrobiota bacterium]